MKVRLYQCGLKTERCQTQYPLGLGYLKANAPASAEVEIVQDAAALTNCDLVGLSSGAASLREAVDILKQLNGRIPVVIGGQGTLWEGLQAFPFKHIVIGEGEQAFADIVTGTASDAQVLHYPGVKNLDDLQPPVRGRCGDRVPIFTSRGCPYSCRYCSGHTFWPRVRFHSAERVLAEVQQIAIDYPASKMIAIFDDLLIAHKARFEKIYTGWMAAGLEKRFSLRGFVRADLFTHDMARKMKRMGFIWVRFGAESGSDRVLKLLGKGETVADHCHAIEAAQAAGLPIKASFMYDIPGETAEDREATKQFIEKYKGILDVMGQYKFQPFPGTAFWDGRSPLTERMVVR